MKVKFSGEQLLGKCMFNFVTSILNLILPCILCVLTKVLKLCWGFAIL